MAPKEKKILKFHNIMLVQYDDETLLVKERLTFQDNINNFKLFIWNPRKREVLGRTKESWLKICAFYLCYYICLGAFFASCVAVHLSTVDWYKPEYEYASNVMNQQTIDGKLIGVSPGLGFRPHVNPETSLIRVKSSASSSNHPYNYVQYVKQLDEFLQNFDSKGGEIVHTFGADTPCLDSRNYEYDKAKPCVILKLNKLYGWMPEAYNKTDPLPKELKPYEEIVRAYPENIFVLCEGENPVSEKFQISNLYFKTFHLL